MIRASSEPRRQGGRGRERETRTGDTHYYRVWTLPGEHRSTLTTATLPAPGEEKVQVQEQEPGARWPGAG